MTKNTLTPETPEIHELLSQGYPMRLAQQFFTHSAHAPVTILILECLLSGPAYFSKPDGYLLILAALGQAAWLAHPRADNVIGVFVGNLIGVALYSFAESLIEGLSFVFQSQHIAYWFIAASFSVIQTVRLHYKNRGMGLALLLLENIFRAAIPVLLYALFEARSKSESPDLSRFFSDEAHLYLTIIVLLLGVLLGFAELTVLQAQRALRAMAQRLHQLSSWGFGAHVVKAALTDGNQVSLKRCERSLLFMDIRGFTAWSERQSPETVVLMLNTFYVTCESTLKPYAPIKIKFTADEVMAVFSERRLAFKAARDLQHDVESILGAYGLAAGGSLHAGPVVEGLLGSDGVKAYDVIGDTVNTASRLCAAAHPGELLVSEGLLHECSPSQAYPLRHVDAKGKQAPLAAYVLRNEPMTVDHHRQVTPG